MSTTNITQRFRTLLPHETQQQIAAEGPEAPPFASTGTVAGDIGASVGREAVAQMRRGGPLKALWIAVGLLAAGYVHHYMDGLGYAVRAQRNEELLEWLVMCKLAEQQQQLCPPIPLGIAPR